jgi:hypothetical protein
LDDLKRKNKSLIIDKSNDYFQTVLKLRFGSTVSNAVANVVGDAAAVADI